MRYASLIDIPTLVWPGDDESHATSAAHQARELIPHAQYWDVLPPKHTAWNILERLQQFLSEVEASRETAAA
jgi:hypothetical protein